MGNRGAIALAKALCHNTSLISLRLDENLIGLLGFINLMNAMKTNKNLRQFNLPLLDVTNCLKSESAEKSEEIHRVLTKLEKRALGNQMRAGIQSE